MEVKVRSYTPMMLKKRSSLHPDVLPSCYSAADSRCWPPERLRSPVHTVPASAACAARAPRSWSSGRRASAAAESCSGSSRRARARSHAPPGSGAPSRAAGLSRCAAAAGRRRARRSRSNSGPRGLNNCQDPRYI